MTSPDDTDPETPVVVEHGGAGVGPLDALLVKSPALKAWVNARPALRHTLSLFGPSGRARRQRIPFPWGLVALVIGYIVLVTGWMALRYWNSPEHQGAVAYAEARQLLGKDGGRSLSQPELERAFTRMLDAALLMPQVRTLHEELESLRWRYDERRIPLPPAFVHGAEEASRRYVAIEKAKEPILVVGARDRGWDWESLSTGPATFLLWAVILGVLGLLVAASIWWTGVVAAWEERESHVRAREQEVAALGQFREGLKERPRRTPQTKRPPSK